MYANRFYVRETIPGISGFQRWDEREYSVVTGRKAKNCRSEIIGEFAPERFLGDWRLCTGQAPEYQPIRTLACALEWLAENVWAAIAPVDGECPPIK